MTDETKETAMVPARDAFACAFDPPNIQEAARLANSLAKSTLVPDAIRNRASDILVIMITGRELGLSTMQALRSINVIKGKGVASAEMMVAQCVKNKDICEYFRLVESDNEYATYETKRAGSEPVKMTYSMRDAALAGIAEKHNWKAHPGAMLRARCSSAMARAVYPDLVAGIYETGEGEEIQAQARPVTQAEVVEAEKPLEIVAIDPEGLHEPYVGPPPAKSPTPNDPKGEYELAGDGSPRAKRPAPSGEKREYDNKDREFTDNPVPPEYWKIPKDERRGDKAQELLGGPGYFVGKNDDGKWMICQKKVPF